MLTTMLILYLKSNCVHKGVIRGSSLRLTLVYDLCQSFTTLTEPSDPTSTHRETIEMNVRSISAGVEDLVLRKISLTRAAAGDSGLKIFIRLQELRDILQAKIPSD
jgi:hypothetical protein